MNITTRYSIDDLVFLVRIARIQVNHDCETCKGVGELKAVTDDGTEVSVPCPKAKIYHT